MALTIGMQPLRTVARSTYKWVDALEHSVAGVSRTADWAQVQHELLSNISADAASISWGTSNENYHAASGLVDAINGLAIAAGHVDPATGGDKAPDVFSSLVFAKRANGQVQTLMMQHDWNPTGHEYNWPS